MSLGQKLSKRNIIDKPHTVSIPIISRIYIDALITASAILVHQWPAEKQTTLKMGKLHSK